MELFKPRSIRKPLSRGRKKIDSMARLDFVEFNGKRAVSKEWAANALALSVGRQQVANKLKRALSPYKAGGLLVPVKVSSPKGAHIQFMSIHLFESILDANAKRLNFRQKARLGKP